MEIRSFEDVICVIFCLASLFSIFKGGGITAEPQLCSSSTCRQSPDLQSTCSFSNLALAGLTKHWGKLLRCLFTEKRELLKLHPSWRVWIKPWEFKNWDPQEWNGTSWSKIIPYFFGVAGVRVFPEESFLQKTYLQNTSHMKTGYKIPIIIFWAHLIKGIFLVSPA